MEPRRECHMPAFWSSLLRRAKSTYRSGYHSPSHVVSTTITKGLLWQLMQTLLLEPGDLLQVKSTDLPPGRFIKIQPQSTSFLDISDPKAVLENAFRNFSCLTKGDVFTFAYNDQVYEMAVLDAKPQNDKNAISVLETDLEVDVEPPVGYEGPTRTRGTSTPRSAATAPMGGVVHSHGTMAQA